MDEFCEWKVLVDEVIEVIMKSIGELIEKY